VRQVVDRPVSMRKGPRLHFELADETVGAVEVVELAAPAQGAFREMTPTLIRLAQRQPMARPKKNAK
jgi:hypothetical protein